LEIFNYQKMGRR